MTHAPDQILARNNGKALQTYMEVNICVRNHEFYSDLIAFIFFFLLFIMLLKQIL